MSKKSHSIVCRKNLKRSMTERIIKKVIVYYVEKSHSIVCWKKVTKTFIVLYVEKSHIMLKSWNLNLQSSLYPQQLISLSYLWSSQCIVPAFYLLFTLLKTKKSKCSMSKRIMKKLWYSMWKRSHSMVSQKKVIA